MLGTIAIALEFAQIAPQIIDAGINIAGLVAKIRASLDADAAPSDPDWQAADSAVNSLIARANDPATDSR